MLFCLEVWGSIIVHVMVVNGQETKNDLIAEQTRAKVPYHKIHP